jgi:hypothetical protein
MSASDRSDVVHACAFDLRPVPPARRLRRSTYCCESCLRKARNWRNRTARKEAIR